MLVPRRLTTPFKQAHRVCLASRLVFSVRSGYVHETVFVTIRWVVGVAQLVRAPDCGSGGRGFNSRHSPHFSSFNVQPSALFSFLNPVVIHWSVDSDNRVMLLNIQPASEPSSVE